MELSPAELMPRQGCSFQEASKHLDEVKVRVKKAYKKAALKHHPDRPDGDEEKMKILSSAMEIVESLTLQPGLPPPPPRPVRVVRIVRVEYHGDFSNSSTTGTGTFTGWSGGGGGSGWFRKATPQRHERLSPTAKLIQPGLRLGG